MISVLFVCLGNICRSPTAEGVFTKLVNDSNHGDFIEIDSAGTSDWHIGHPPDSRATAMALSRGIDISSLKARQVLAHDLSHYDYILAMDKQNLEDLMLLANDSNGNGSNIKLLLNFSDKYREAQVPDPYFGGELGFNKALDMIENASQGLLKTIIEEHGPN